jgi:hypothetical protein
VKSYHSTIVEKAAIAIDMREMLGRGAAVAATSGVDCVIIRRKLQDDLNYIKCF